MIAPPQCRSPAPASAVAFGQPLALQRLPLCPEIQLWLIDGRVDLDAACGSLREGEEPPYWAFCWGSGQALARFLLDHPHEVRDLRVVDLGTGSGVAAIAAALAGARSVVAVDRDAAALAAAHGNAAVNGVQLETAREVPADWDVLVASDVLYEHALHARLLELARLGRRVLLSEPERPFRPRLELEPRARLEVRTLPDVDSPVRAAAIFQLA